MGADNFVACISSISIAKVVDVWFVRYFFCERLGGIHFPRLGGVSLLRIPYFSSFIFVAKGHYLAPTLLGTFENAFVPHVKHVFVK